MCRNRTSFSFRSLCVNGLSYEAEGVFVWQCVFSLCGRARDHLLRIKGEAGKHVISRRLREF